MLFQCLIWREQNAVDSILDTWEAPEVLRKYYPGGLYGFDKDDCPIYFEPLGYSDVKGITQQ